MEPKERAYLDFARVCPKAFREHVARVLAYGGSAEDVNSYLGSSILLSFIVFIAVSLIPWALGMGFREMYFIFGLAFFILVQAVYYMLAYLKAEDRTARIEAVLPDALQLVSANLKAGMTPFQALKASSRKEFGPLKEEIDRAVAKSLGTESFEEALMQISQRIKSELLERSLKLFTSAMKSGSHLAALLEELSKDIAETRSLKKELTTNTKNYMMLIMFTVIIGTPLLMAIAVHFLGIITDLQAKTGASAAGFGMEFLAGEIAISTDFLAKISVFLLIMTSLLACMFIGVLKEGKAKYGLRYSPVVLAGSFAVFFIVRYLIGRVF